MRLCSFGKRAGKVCWFFENVEQGSRTVDAVAFGLCRLLHNSGTLQLLDCALCGCEGNAQFAANTGGGDEWIGRQQIDKLNDIDPESCLQRLLEKIADLLITRIHELLPWNYTASQTDLGSSQVST